MRITLWSNGYSTGAKIMGRKRKLDVDRYPCGQIVHEKPAEIMAVVTSQRAKDVGPEHAAKYEAGFELGKAYLRRQITRKQLKAGEQWAMDVDRYARMNGLPSPFPKAMDWLSVRGASNALEMDADKIRVITSTYMKGITAVSQRRGSLVACRTLCIEDSSSRGWPDHTIQALRAGLDGLASLYGIPELIVEESEKAA
jgi:hypothetical protein